MRTISRTMLAVTATVATTLAFGGTAGAQGKRQQTEVLPKGWAAAHGAHGGAAADPDRDGLSNWGEWRSGTRPGVADTDHDGVRDDREDRDRDGLRNGMEVRLATDPRTRDTDRDGVPDGAEDADCDGLANAAEQAAAQGHAAKTRPAARATKAARNARTGCDGAGGATRPAGRRHNAAATGTASADSSAADRADEDQDDEEAVDDPGTDDAADGGIEYDDWSALLDDPASTDPGTAGGSADDEWSDDGADWGGDWGDDSDGGDQAQPGDEDDLG